MTTAPMLEEIQQPEEEAAGIYIDDHRQGASWFVEWEDHAGRVLKRRLGTVASLGRNEQAIFPLASEAVQTYIDTQQMYWQNKHAASQEELDGLCNHATFPRAVVAREILRICERISRDANDERNGRPGLQLFADRVGISGREIHRIIEDPRRITVGVDVVDKICCEFDMLFDDFIASALEWASKSGSWSGRAGAEDPWPWGYTQLKIDIGHDPI